MRKAFSLLFILLIIGGLSACAVTPQVKADNIIFQFTCKAKIKMQDKEYSCCINRSAPQTASITLLAPDTLKGMTYNWNGSNFSMTYQGITAEHDSCVLPETSFSSLMIRVLDAANKTDILKRKSSNEFTGTLDDADFTITVDQSSGYIQQIQFPKYNLHADLEYTV